MNYSSEEVKAAFLVELRDLLERYGFGLDIGGYEFSVRFVPLEHSNLLLQFRAAMTDTYGIGSAGWDDQAVYGPPVPDELMSPVALAYRKAFNKALEMMKVLEQIDAAAEEGASVTFRLG